MLVSIPYILKPQNNRSKHIRITISRTGDVYVSKPKHVTLAQVDAFIFRKSDWINNHLNKIKSNQAQKNIDSKITHKDYLSHKNIALQLVTKKLDFYNKHYKFTYKNIVIRNQKTRWGSCSKRGNLNFNYRIAIIPEYLADYIIVHELCHLGQFNHSQKFWDLVSETIPDYRHKVRELKDFCLF